VEDSAPISIQQWNEIKKLEASWFDRLSTVCITVGVAAPIAASTFAAQNDHKVPVIGFLFWIFSSIVLHILARFSILEMKQS
jgi:hypothetical protein